MSHNSTTPTAAASAEIKTPGQVMIPLPMDDPRRPLNDSGLPSVMIWAGGDAYDNLTMPGVAERALDLDSCALAVGIYRAMTEAHAREIATLFPAPAPDSGRGTAEGDRVLALEAVASAARAMPRATPAPGGAGTAHTFRIEAGIVWTLDHALTALDAAPTPPLVLPDGWRPIATAPKDGTVIVIWRKGWARPVAAYWCLSAAATTAGVGSKRFPWVFLDETNGLNSAGEDGLIWRPLPAPPAGEA